MSERHEMAGDSLKEALSRFRESRVYVQIVLSLGLISLAGIATFLPYGPFVRIKEVFTWAVMHDYDFRDQALQVSTWAQRRGGWGSAVRTVWSVGLTRARGWMNQFGEFNHVAPPQLSSIPSVRTEAPNLQADLRPVLPVDGAVLFGFGWLPIGAGDQFHDGLDMVAPAGSAVTAVSDGMVQRVGDDPERGAFIEIEHEEIVALYAQIEKVQVKAGQRVYRGQAIASVARSTGREQSLPPHLHLEIRTRKERVSVDPAYYLGIGGKQL